MKELVLLGLLGAAACGSTATAPANGAAPANAAARANVAAPVNAAAPVKSEGQNAGAAPPAAGDMVEGVNFAREPGQPLIEETYPDAAGMPRDVQAYIIRHSDCTHWGGEYSEEPERQRQIQEGVRQACGGVNELGRRIRARYAGNAQVLARLRDYQPVEE